MRDSALTIMRTCSAEKLLGCNSARPHELAELFTGPGAEKNIFTEGSLSTCPDSI